MTDKKKAGWTPQERFRTLLEYPGWGDPGSSEKPSVWFIGIEEGGKWAADPEIKNKASWDRYVNKQTYETGNPFPKNDTGNEYSFKSPRMAVLRGVSEVMFRVIQQHKKFDSGAARLKSAEEYARKRLWRKGSRVFHSNIFPLAKPAVSSWPKEYKDTFGFGEGDLKIYYEQVKTHRFPLLRELKRIHNPAMVICFGKGSWPSFKKAFELERQKVDDNVLCIKPMETHVDKKATLVYHFSRNYLMDEDFNHLADIVANTL